MCSSPPSIDVFCFVDSKDSSICFDLVCKGLIMNSCVVLEALSNCWFEEVRNLEDLVQKKEKVNGLCSSFSFFECYCTSNCQTLNNYIDE